MSSSNNGIISIIISTYNQPDYLKLTLQSIAKQENISFNMLEVLIADDGSQDDTSNLIKELIPSYPCQIKHIWHEDLGFRKSAILNKAVAASVGEYLIFIDGDCVIPADYISSQLKLRETGYFVAGNRVLMSKEYTTEILRENIALESLHKLQWIVLYIKKSTNKLLHFVRLPPNSNWRKLRRTNWRYPKGCNIGVSRDDYIAVNGYDESFSGWGHEDADFFVRLLHNNIYIKDGRFSVPVFHLWHKLNSRENEEENMKRLQHRIDDKNLITAKLGLSQYI
ncbi:MAG: glycosyltransferase [Neisseriaceae bacterium]|nr:MAG: glycosyltransferase [Neisseriaceae bacterium]